MAYIVDILLIALFIYYIVSASKKGLALSLLDFAATLLAGVAAYFLSALVAPALYGAFFEKTVVTAIEAQLPSSASAASIAQETQAVIDSLPEFVLKVANSVGINVSSISADIGSMNLAGSSMAQALADNVAQPIITAVIRAISFIVLLVISVILFKILARFINKVFKLPVLKTANKALGAVVGALKGAVAVLLVALSLSVFASLIGDSTSKLVEIIDSSKIVSVAQDFNPIVSLTE